MPLILSSRRGGTFVVPVFEAEAQSQKSLVTDQSYLQYYLPQSQRHDTSSTTTTTTVSQAPSTVTSTTQNAIVQSIVQPARYVSQYTPLHVNVQHAPEVHPEVHDALEELLRRLNLPLPPRGMPIEIPPGPLAPPPSPPFVVGFPPPQWVVPGVGLLPGVVWPLAVWRIMPRVLI